MSKFKEYFNKEVSENKEEKLDEQSYTNKKYDAERILSRFNNQKVVVEVDGDDIIITTDKGFNQIMLTKKGWEYQD